MKTSLACVDSLGIFILCLGWDSVWGRFLGILYHKALSAFMTLKDLANGFATLKILSWNFKQSIGARNQIVPARQAGGIHSLESIPGLHKRLKIPALVIKKDQARSIIS